MEEIMQAVMTSPEALFVGVVVGFAAAKMSGRKRGGGMMM